jgi:hypothetical protein
VGGPTCLERRSVHPNRRGIRGDAVARECRGAQVRTREGRLVRFSQWNRADPHRMLAVEGVAHARVRHGGHRLRREQHRPRLRERHGAVFCTPVHRVRPSGPSPTRRSWTLPTRPRPARRCSPSVPTSSCTAPSSTTSTSSMPTAGPARLTSTLDPAHWHAPSGASTIERGATYEPASWYHRVHHVPASIGVVNRIAAPRDPLPVRCAVHQVRTAFVFGALLELAGRQARSTLVGGSKRRAARR